MRWSPEKVRQLRKSRGETQEEFAAHFRLKVDAVRTWEQDKGSPSGPACVILDQLACEVVTRQPIGLAE